MKGRINTKERKPDVSANRSHIAMEEPFCLGGDAANQSGAMAARQEPWLSEASGLTSSRIPDIERERP
jgi:hypothetical protein